MLVSVASDAACSAALQQALDEYGIVDTALLQAVLEIDAAGLARALCTSLQAAPPAASEPEDAVAIAVRSVGTQAAVAADDMVDTATAEAMIAEALRMRHG